MAIDYFNNLLHNLGSLFRIKLKVKGGALRCLLYYFLALSAGFFRASITIIKSLLVVLLDKST
ncbi:MAG: hypothetical protein ACK5RM_19695, partial [Pseudanabaena sp.]